MRHEGEILFAALLDLKRFLRRISLNGKADRMAKNTIDDVKRHPLQIQTMTVRQIVNTLAEDIIFRHDFLDVEAVLKALGTMDERAAFEQRFGNCLVRSRFERGCQFVNEARNVIVEGRCVEVLRRGKLSYLLSPAREQGATFVLHEHCQCIEWVGGHLDSETIGLHESAGLDLLAIACHTTAPL